MLAKVGPYLKAIVAFLAPAAVALTASVQADSAGGAAVTPGEWIAAVCACFITGAIVFTVPNMTPSDEPEDGSEPTA